MLILICYERKTLLNNYLILTDKLKRTEPIIIITTTISKLAVALVGGGGN
jgi:hypothetical protein